MEEKKVSVRKFKTKVDTINWFNENKESGNRTKQGIGIFSSVIHPGTLEAIYAMQLGGFTPEETLDALAYHYINTAANILYRASGIEDDEGILEHRGKFAEIAIIRAAEMASGLGMDWEKGARDDDDNKE